MKTFALLFCATLAGLAFPHHATAEDSGARVSFLEKDDATIEIRIGDDVLGIFNHGPTWKKPFLYPLNAANGTNVLRGIIPTKDQEGSSKAGSDHFHHKGVWASVDSVNDEKLNFWSEGERIRNDSVETTTAANGSGILVSHNTWLQGETPLLKETTTITFYPSRLITYRIELSAIDRDVTVFDTKEGFFAVRLAHTMRETEGGHIINADGATGEKDAWGRQSPWVDYYGDVGGATLGVTLMDHPGNFRKSRYHVRSYGLFAISPFGPETYSRGEEAASPVTIKPDGAPLKLTYGLYVHAGDTQAGNVKEAYEKFLQVTE
ncbi:MAG: PmoA family protein [Planctomycetaceae bacterium]